MNDALPREVLMFNAALQLPASQRADYLSEACGDDGQLRSRVSELLQAHEGAGLFLQDSDHRPSATADAAIARQRDGGLNQLERPGENCGDRVGSYKLLQQIGEGGCGIVYMAEQEEPVRRRVALKVIKLGMDTKQVIARFEAERQALAMMDHPNIAKVFDAGATATGRPYFVMELVRGVQLTDFCDTERLSTEARLQLFIQICHAIQHAHQKGVIHRDIKPSNILVSVNDGLPVPKVIDFGIAKATQGRLTDQTFFTAFEQFIGTPAYMSPEQAVLTSVEVDTRSDIYSLGVLLYEMLTGQTPFAQKELLASGLDEMRRTIREKDPVRPSTKLSAMVAADLATVARNRHSQPPQLIHLVRGDLDWIVMKCLQKERARRYETANGLALDLERHLGNQPVLARPDVLTYRMAKFVRRHRASVTFASIIFIALIGGLTGTITQARRATLHAALAETQRRRADEEARAANTQRDFALRQLSRAEAINDLNSDLLSEAPSGKSFTVGELLERAERVIDRQSGESAENRVELLIAIGDQHFGLDEFAKARTLLEKAYTLSLEVTEPAVRAKAAAALGDALSMVGEFERGESLVSKALAELGESPQYTLHRVYCLLCASHVARESGKSDLGLERIMTARRLLRESGQGSPLLNLTVAMDVAESYRLAGRNRDAADTYAEAFKQVSALGRDDTDKAATLLHNWGLVVEVLGQPLEAERLYRRSIAIDMAGGSEESLRPTTLNSLARVLVELRRFSEAADYAERAYVKAQSIGAEKTVTTSLYVRGCAYRDLGDFTRAAEMFDQAEARWKRMMPAGHRVFASLASSRSQLALARGDLPAALVQAEEAVALAEASPAAPDFLKIILLRRANLRMQLNKFEESRADAARALALHEGEVGTNFHCSILGRAHLALARALRAKGKLEEARAEYALAVGHLGPSLGKEHPEAIEAARGL